MAHVTESIRLNSLSGQQAEAEAESDGNDWRNSWESDSDTPEEGQALLPSQQSSTKQSLIKTDAEAGYPPSTSQRDSSDSDHAASSLINKLVPLEDDPHITTLSVRVFVLGISFCVLGASISGRPASPRGKRFESVSDLRTSTELFFFKSSAPSLSAFFIILIVLPLGRAMARYLPVKVMSVGPYTFNLNPGPFTAKEHMLTVILAGSGASAA